MAPGIVAGDRCESSTPTLVILGLVVVLAIPFGLRKRRTIAALGWLALFGFAFGFELGLLHHLPPQENHYIHCLDSHGDHLTLEGRINGSPEKARKSWHVLVDVETCFLSDNRPTPCNGKLLLYVASPGPEQKGGERIRFDARLRPVRSEGNPGAFDYASYLGRRDIFATAYIRDARSLHTTQPAPFSSFLTQRRSEFARFIEKRFAPEDVGWVLALTVGMRKFIDPEVRQLFSRAGTAHLLAISGLHLGIVALFVFLLVRQSLRFAPRLLMYCEADRLSAGVTLPILWTYAALAGFHLSTLRAGVMVTTYLLSKLLLRRSDALNSLFLAAFIILIFDASALFDLSFQLSFVSVLAILTMIPRRLYALSLPMATDSPAKRLLLRVRTYFLSILISSFVCFLATLPIIAWRFGMIPLVGVLANLIAVPLVTLAALPMFALGLTVWMLFGSTAAPLIEIGAEAVRLAITLQEPLVQVLPSSWHPAIPYWFVFLWYGVLFLFWSILQRPVLSFVALAFLTMGLASGRGFPRADSASLRLLHLRSGAAVFVEWHEDPPWLFVETSTEENERVIVPYLRHRGIRNLGWLYSLSQTPDGIPEPLLEEIPSGFLSLGGTQTRRQQITPKWPPATVQVEFYPTDSPPLRLGLIRFGLKTNGLLFVPHPERTDVRFWQHLPDNVRAEIVVLTQPVHSATFRAIIERTGAKHVAVISNSTPEYKIPQATHETLRSLSVCLWQTNEQGSILIRPVKGRWKLSAPNPPDCSVTLP